MLLQTPKLAESSDWQRISAIFLRMAAVRPYSYTFSYPFKCVWNRRVPTMLMKAKSETSHLIHELLAQRILVLDGSMGALIFSRKPSEADYRGSRFAGHDKPLKNCT